MQKGFTAGTHRVVSPSETLERFMGKKESMGITRLCNITHLDNIGIPVVIAVRPASRSLSVSQGKGLTLEAAKASALMESIETYHAERIELPLRLASYRELSKANSVV